MEQTPTISIGILNYVGAQRAAVFGLTDLLESAARLHSKRTGQRRLETLCLDEGLGLSEPDGPLTALILPPSLQETPPTSMRGPLGDWIRQRHSEGTILCSVCVGAFMLGELALLDGRPATTHWALKKVFTERYPNVHLDTDRLIVDDGDIITAGGLMAWVDLGLRLVGRFLGPSTMLETARFFLIDPGGREQRFYSSFSPVLTHGDGAILAVQRWLQTRIGQSAPVVMMAATAGLERRTFLRRFQRATGLKTREYVQQLCVSRTRELLELTLMTQQEIALAVGYEDPGALRKVFVKLMGLSPGEYRRRFGCHRTQPGVPKSAGINRQLP